MWKINNNILGTKTTLITNFMCDTSKQNKTFNELVEIFNNCKEKITTNKDPSNDLRIIKFIHDMKNDNWKSPIIILSVNGVVQDGVHRGIAYLTCIKEGISKKDLPEVLINEPNF